jgi:hypothetical protein
LRAAESTLHGWFATTADDAVLPFLPPSQAKTGLTEMLDQARKHWSG